MTWVAAAIGGSAILGAYTGNRASKRQAETAREGIAAQRAMFDEQNRLNEPFRQAGLTGQNRYMELMGLGGDPKSLVYGKYAKDPTLADIQMDPGYQFRLTEGLKALDRRNAAAGMGYRGGAATKAATRYSQDYASGEYGRAFDRYNVNRANQLNPLLSLMDKGQLATGAMTTAAGNLGSSTAAGLADVGAAQAAGLMRPVNAITGGIGQGINYYQNKRLMDIYQQGLPTYGAPSYNSLTRPSGPLNFSEYEMR